MQTKNSKHSPSHAFQLWSLGRCAFSLLTIALSLPNISVAETTQAEAQREAKRMHQQASDRSLENSTTNAMKALMFLDSGQYPSALANGYKAYGQFRTSENLDYLNAVDKQNEGRMHAPGGILAGELKPPNTSFSRLSPSFLRQGEAKEIADQFEKRTGMRRENFLKSISSLSEKDGYIVLDSNALKKINAEVRRFVYTFPPSAFRDNTLEKLDSVPSKTVARWLEKGLLHVLPAWIDFAAVFSQKKEEVISQRDIQKVKLKETPTWNALPNSKKTLLSSEVVDKKFTPPDPLLNAMLEAARESAEKSIFDLVRGQYQQIQVKWNSVSK